MKNNETNLEELQKCDYCEIEKNKKVVSPLLSNGYHICDDCKKKNGWDNLETMDMKDEKERIARK